MKSRDLLAEQNGESAKQVQRYIRLTNLIPELLSRTEQKKISFNPAVELSYLKQKEQEEFLEVMDQVRTAPSVSQAQRMKKLSQAGLLTKEMMVEIMNGLKKDDPYHVTFRNETLRKYFPKYYSVKQMQDEIIRMLDQWQKRKKRDRER